MRAGTNKARPGTCCWKTSPISHRLATAWPLPPTAAACTQIVEAHACFQAAWWDDPRLGESVGEWRDTEAYTQRFADAYARFLGRFGEHVPAQRRRTYEQLLGSAARLFARHRSHRQMTIVHGDAHVWNCFLPRDAGTDLRFFDWDCWNLNVGATDLAYMIAIHWYPDRRKHLERMLLGRYHAALVAHGVRDYGRDLLDDDYRRAVLLHIATPVWQALNGIPPVIWWNNMERVFLAVDDLGSHDLLAP